MSRSVLFQTSTPPGTVSRLAVVRAVDGASAEEKWVMEAGVDLGGRRIIKKKISVVHYDPPHFISYNRTWWTVPRAPDLAPAAARSAMAVVGDVLGAFPR